MRNTFHRFANKISCKALLRRSVSMMLALTFFASTGIVFEISGSADAERDESAYAQEYYAAAANNEPVDKYDSWIDSVSDGKFIETPIDGAYTEDTRTKDGIIYLTWVDDPDNPYTFTAPIDKTFKTPYREHNDAYIKIVVSSNGEITDLGGYREQFYNNNNSTWLGSQFAPIVVKSDDSVSYYYPAADFINIFGNIDNLWGIVAKGSGVVKSFGLVLLEAVIERETNKIYYRTRDKFGDYIFGTDRKYLLGDGEESDIHPLETIDVYAEVDTENFKFEYNSRHFKKIGNINYEYDEELEKWVMTATYKVIDFFEDGEPNSVRSQIILAGTDVQGDTVTSAVTFNIEKIELNKIYYKGANESSYRLNETNEANCFRIFDGDVIEVFTEIYVGTTDPDEMYSLLGSIFGFFVEGSELSLRGSVVCRLADKDNCIWRISAAYTADIFSEHALIDLKNNGDIADTIHVKIDYEPNKIYYKLPGEESYRKNYNRTISTYKDDVIDLIALVDNTDAIFEVGDASKFNLSGMVHESAVDGRYYLKTGAAAINVTNFDATTPIYLKTGKANNNPVDTLDVNIKEITHLHVHNMTLGNMKYDYVDIHTATNMLTGGFNNQRNSNSNRYVVFVGETLDLSATLQGSFTGYDKDGIFKSLGATDDEITGNNSAEIVESTIRLLAQTPGNVEITFKSNTGVDSQTFYVTVCYPIYVKKVGEYTHKNRIHEYLWQAFWTTGGPNFIYDMNFNPVYAKNVDNGDLYRYHMFPGGTVELMANVLLPDGALNCSSDHEEQGLPHVDSCFQGFTVPKFSVTQWWYPATIQHTYAVEEIGGVKYIKVMAEVTVSQDAGSQSINVSFNNSTNPLEIFYIYVMPYNMSLQHFDIEIADGGTYTTVEVITEVDENGNPIKRTVTEITYTTIVSAVSECRIYDESGNLLHKLEEWEYWKHGVEGEDTQFEITSAYITDRETREPPDPANPALKDRSVTASLIDKVVFDLTLDINPMATRRLVSMWDPDQDEWIILEEDDPRYTPPPTVEEVGKKTINNYSTVMLAQDIIDAINKCPNHGGGDFTLLADNNYPTVSLEFTKRLVGTELRNNQFPFDLYEDTRSYVDGTKPDFADTDSIKRVDVAFNKADGLVAFRSIEYENEGTHIYYVVERLGTDESITYDQTIKKIVVEIAEVHDDNLNNIYDYLLGATITYYHWDDEGQQWVWDDSSREFTNYYQMSLLETGGSGTRLYVYGGGAIVLVGFVLLDVFRRRRADS